MTTTTARKPAPPLKFTGPLCPICENETARVQGGWLCAMCEALWDRAGMFVAWMTSHSQCPVHEVNPWTSTDHHCLLAEDHADTYHSDGQFRWKDYEPDER